MSHIMSGVKIMEEVNEPELIGSASEADTKSNFTHAPREKFEVLFNRLDNEINQVCHSPHRFCLTSAFQMLGTRPMALRNSSKSAWCGFGPEIPETFASLEYARNSLEYQSNRYPAFLKRMESEQSQSEEGAEEGRQHFRSILDAWNVGFENFLDHPNTNLDAKSQKAVCVLQIYRRIGVMHLMFPVSRMLTDEMIWDAFVSDGERIVALAEEVVGVEDATPTLARPTFAFESSIVRPLYSVANKCRDPVIRRKAIALLRSAPRQEGIWDSQLAAKVAERVMTIEESGLGEVRSCRDVPYWARISEVDANFDMMETKASFTYSRQHSEWDVARESFSETITW